MAIQKINSDSVDVVCVCGHERNIAFGSLVLGHDTGTDKTNPHLVVLAPCPSCGSVEMWHRAFDVMPPEGLGTPADHQRRAVNRIATELKARGRSSPRAKAVHDAEGADPPDVHPPTINDVRLPAQVKQARDARRAS